MRKLQLNQLRKEEVMDNPTNQPIVDTNTIETTTNAEVQEARQVDSTKVLTYLERLGVSQEDLTSEDFNENKLASKILSNEAYTSDHNKSVTLKHDDFLTGKLKKALTNLTGISEEELTEETDFTKILTKSIDKIKSTGNSDIDTISLEYRTKELGYQSQLEDLKNQLEVEKNKMSNELKDYKVNMKVNSFVDSSNLTTTAKANQTEIIGAALNSIKSKFDIREKDGMLVLYNGSQPVYKDNSSKHTLLEDELGSYLDRMGFVKKQEEVKSLTGTTANPIKSTGNKGKINEKGKYTYRR